MITILAEITCDNCHNSEHAIGANTEFKGLEFYKNIGGIEQNNLHFCCKSCLRQYMDKNK